MNPLLVSVAALKEIQYTYTGAGHSYEDLLHIKAVTEKALKTIGAFDMSLEEFQARAKASKGEILALHWPRVSAVQVSLTEL